MRLRPARDGRDFAQAVGDARRARASSHVPSCRRRRGSSDGAAALVELSVSPSAAPFDAQPAGIGGMVRVAGDRRRRPRRPASRRRRSRPRNRGRSSLRAGAVGAALHDVPLNRRPPDSGRFSLVRRRKLSPSSVERAPPCSATMSTSARFDVLGHALGVAADVDMRAFGEPAPKFARRLRACDPGRRISPRRRATRRATAASAGRPCAWRRVRPRRRNRLLRWWPKNSQLRPARRVAVRSCRKARNGATPVPGTDHDDRLRGSSGNAKRCAFCT